VEPSDSWKIMDAGDADAAQLREEPAHVAQGIDAIDAGDHRGRLDLWEHLALGHAKDEFVGIADRQHAGQRTIAAPAELTGVVDADEVDAAALDELCRYAVAGGSHDQCPACRGLCPEPVETLLSGVADGQPIAPRKSAASGRSVRSPLRSRRQDR